MLAFNFHISLNQTVYILLIHQGVVKTEVEQAKIGILMMIELVKKKTSK